MNKSLFILSKELVDYTLEWAASKKNNKPNYEQLVWLVEELITKHYQNNSKTAKLESQIADLQDEIKELERRRFRDQI